MNDTNNLKDETIRLQAAYIRQLEEQLDILKQKDSAQELLIEELLRLQALLEDEFSAAKIMAEGLSREEG